MPNTWTTTIRWNLDKPLHLKAWEYLVEMDKRQFHSYSNIMALAITEYFDRYYKSQADPYLETRQREELFVEQIVEGVERSLDRGLPMFLAGVSAAGHHNNGTDKCTK